MKKCTFAGCPSVCGFWLQILNALTLKLQQNLHQNLHSFSCRWGFACRSTADEPLHYFRPVWLYLQKLVFQAAIIEIGKPWSFMSEMGLPVRTQQRAEVAEIKETAERTVLCGFQMPLLWIERSVSVIPATSASRRDGVKEGRVVLEMVVRLAPLLISNILYAVDIP